MNENHTDQFTIDHDPDVIEARRAEAEALATYQVEQERLDVDDAAALRSAQTYLRSAELAFAHNIGSEKDVERARKAVSAARERSIGREELTRLAVIVTDLREQTRQAEIAAAEMVRAKAISHVKEHVERKSNLRAELEKMDAQDSTMLAILEKACPEQLVVIGSNGHGPLMGNRRHGWDERWRQVLGARTPNDSQLAEWQAMAEDTGLLPETEAGKRRRAAQRQRLQEMEAIAKRQNSIDDWRLGHFRAWGAGADLPMPEGKR